MTLALPLDDKGACNAMRLIKAKEGKALLSSSTSFPDLRDSLQWTLSAWINSLWLLRRRAGLRPHHADGYISPDWTQRPDRDTEGASSNYSHVLICGPRHRPGKEGRPKNIKTYWHSAISLGNYCEQVLQPLHPAGTPAHGVVQPASPHVVGGQRRITAATSLRRS